MIFRCIVASFLFDDKSAFLGAIHPYQFERDDSLDDTADLESEIFRCLNLFFFCFRGHVCGRKNNIKLFDLYFHIRIDLRSWDDGTVLDRIFDLVFIDRNRYFLK